LQGLIDAIGEFTVVDSGSAGDDCTAFVREEFPDLRYNIWPHFSVDFIQPIEKDQ